VDIMSAPFLFTTGHRETEAVRNDLALRQQSLN
jgi:hypothetical protein